MYFPKVALLETMRNSLSAFQVYSQQAVTLLATKNELLTRFLKDVYDNKMNSRKFPGRVL